MNRLNSDTKRPQELISTLPDHIGIIMDGNGRWAKKRNLPRIAGHRNAIKALRATVETSMEIGIRILTLYAFSTENWSRPKKEVSFLMNLFEEYLEKELITLLKNNIRLKVLGHIHRLPSKLQDLLVNAIEQTKECSALILCLAVDYGSRDEITNAIREISRKVLENQLNPDEISEQTVSEHLFTNGLNDPDLIIRTSGELRLSNFLLWQSAYSELYFTDVLFPDFNKEALLEAIEAYSKRERRLGRILDEK